MSKPASARSPRTIGTDKSGYANLRNISALPFHDYRVRRAPNLYRLPNYIHFRLTGRAHPYFDNLHHSWSNACDIHHFFNSLSQARTPWLTTFETTLPRWTAYGKGRLEWGLKLQARPQCHALIALSQCTRRLQESLLADWPAYAADIQPKLQVLHPPQPLLLDSMAEKAPLAGPLQLVLVGNDFYRKGGLEVLRVLERGWQKGWDMKLTIVSGLKAGDYATQAGTAEVQAAQAILGRFPDRIQHFSSLPNRKVLDLLRQSDLALLPTWADTYGYFVLEAQAAGVPVITTDIRALPEINPPSNGWQLSVPKDEHGNGILATPRQRQAFRETLEAQLEVTLQSIWENPAVIREKGAASWERVGKYHSITRNAAALESWYDKILREN